MSTAAARILVADDVPLIRLLVQRVLSQAGYEVVAVNDGKAALDATTTAEVPFDLVITNTWMPGMDGPELIKILRSRCPSMPIIHLDDGSGQNNSPIPDDVPTLMKPFDMQALLEEVQRLVPTPR
jgi:CheY-like chemotaxis protein